MYFLRSGTVQLVEEDSVLCHAFIEALRFRSAALKTGAADPEKTAGCIEGERGLGGNFF